MPLSATVTIDPKTSKPLLTVQSEDRSLTLTVTSGLTGASVTTSQLWPLIIVDPTGHTWTQRSDDGKTAVFDY